MSIKRVAIVGTGASGLPAIKTALDYGFHPVAFEQAADMGGLWRYKPKDVDESSVMKSTVINSSKEMTAYSTFPPRAEMPNYMHNKEMLQYLRDYAEKYNLLDYVLFEHRVINIERKLNYDMTLQWNVTYNDKNGNEHCDTFDAVLLATGHHKTPHWPNPWPDQNQFKGNIIHARQYKDHRGYEDKNVVVVGIGNSACDIAVELSRICNQVYLSTRRGAWIFHRIFDYGEPNDLAISRRFHRWFFLRPYLVRKLQRKISQRFDHEIYGLKPKHELLNAHPTVNDELPNRIACGTIKVKPNIKRFYENGIIFEDDTPVDDIDTIIMCTGYDCEFLLLEEGKLIPMVNSELQLYKYMYPVELAEHNNLAVLGFVQPIGSVVPIAEMQCRVFFQVLSGQTQLPSRQEMTADILRKKSAVTSRFVNTRRHAIQVDFQDYMDELAAIIGAKPQLLNLVRTDPRLAYACIFGPNLPYAYRLFGPHKWNGAREAILNVNDRVIKATNPNYLQKRFGYRWIFLITLTVSFVCFWMSFVLL